MTTTQDPWLLPEDGVVDDVAVDIAAHGYRRVRLTVRERELALAKAARLYENGAVLTDIVLMIFGYPLGRDDLGFRCLN